MIWESSYWKDDLLRRAKMLRVRTRQKRWPEASSAKVEQTLMMGFYTIRKLIEAKKLTDALVAKQIPVWEFPATGKPVHLYNWHHIDRLYALEKSKKTQIGVLDLCHQFVHSYIFMFSFDDKKQINGVFFSSDRKRSSRLCHMEIKAVIKLFEEVGRNYPSTSSQTWNAKTGDYAVKSS